MADISLRTAPIIVLVRPQMVENIGATARAMMNCGLTQLRLVAPRDRWSILTPLPADATDPLRIRERLYASASGAGQILDAVEIYEDLPAALSDLHYVYATSARDHDMAKNWQTPREAMPLVKSRTDDGQRIGFLFGPERTGLTHEDMTYANEAIYIPANPDFSSFNLAQAVLVLSYEWLLAGSAYAAPKRKTNRPATKEELHNFFERLESALDQAGFFTTPEIRPSMVRNLRHTIQRAAMTEQEVRTWHGVISALIKKSSQNSKA